MKRNKGIEWRRVHVSSLDLKEWKVAVVGGTGGLGRAISRLLASRGASVTVVGQTFRDSGVPGIEFIKADLSLMREAERIGQALPAEKLDLVIGLLTPSPETYAERLVPLLVSRDLEGYSGAMFDRKGNAVLPSPKLEDASYRNAFIAASETLVARAKVRLSS